MFGLFFVNIYRLLCLLWLLCSSAAATTSVWVSTGDILYICLAQPLYEEFLEALPSLQIEIFIHTHNHIYWSLRLQFTYPECIWNVGGSLCLWQKHRQTQGEEPLFVKRLWQVQLGNIWVNFNSFFEIGTWICKSLNITATISYFEIDAS